MASQTKLSFSYEVKNQIGRGTCGVVFRGRFKPSQARSWKSQLIQQAAIKRVELLFSVNTNHNIENDGEVIALKTLRHPCIVRLLAVEDDENFRNFVFELCVANLEDFIAKKYVGVMPDQIEGLFHMASGLKYIHEKKMIHRDIKPENVLISISINGKQARLKISDFGLSKRVQDGGNHFDVASGLKGTVIYMAAELLKLRNQRGEDLINNCTTATDIFAAGITFFRYLFGGFHPFGTGYYIEGNIMSGNHVNGIEVFGPDNQQFEWLYQLIELEPLNRLSATEIVDRLQTTSSLTWSLANMEVNQEEVLIINQSSPQNLNLTLSNFLEMNRSDLLGKGVYATVFKGKFQNNKVTVKRIQQIDVDDDHHTETKEILEELKGHPNLSHFMFYEQDSHFRYYVLEFCDVSLPEWIENREKYQETMLLTDKQVLFQLTKGLDHMHSKKIAHRNIRPDNVLISLTKPVQMKWSGFTSSKRTDQSGRCSMTRQVKGTHQDYLAPELSIMMDIDCIRCDIFSAGCVFFYHLSRGVGPFRTGDGTIDSTEFQKHIPANHFAYSVITGMTDREPTKRVQLVQVIEYLKPFQPTDRLSLMSYNYKNEISKGSYSNVYRLQEFEGMALAVKKIEYNQNFSREKFVILNQMDHSNVIKTYFYEQDNLDCYFGMELCTTSLDRLYLPDDDPKKYSGPMPTITDEEFCFQLASGLDYIHIKKLVHGSIKPSNILIFNARNQHPQIKLADFGLTPFSRRLNEMQKSFTVKMSGFQDFSYWLAPELIQAVNNQVQELTFTKESDIFSFGSVLFFYSSQGCHLYGQDVNKIVSNTLEDNKRENLSADKFQHSNSNVFPMGLIRWMTANNPKSRPELSEIIQHSKMLLPISPETIKAVGEIRYSRNHVLGSGGQATVFAGWHISSPSRIAVKRIANIDALSTEDKEKVNRERDSFQRLEHDNVVKLFGFAEKGSFLFLALEKCLTTLDAYCKKPLLYRGTVPMPSDDQVLLQMAEGLQFIHNKGIIHRDVNPSNVLISYDKPAVMKWSDFGMSRNVPTGSKTFTWSNLIGTERWMAPELIVANDDDKFKGSFKCDIFALGCVFFFFLVPGKHPYGDNIANTENIKTGNRVFLDKLKDGHFAYDIVKKMTEFNKDIRPSLFNIISNLKTFKKLNATETSEVTMVDDSENPFRRGEQMDPNAIPEGFTFGRDNESEERVLRFQGGASNSTNTTISAPKTKKRKS